MAYFAYIDDAGGYQQQRDGDFVKRNPYYIRSCVLIPDKKWIQLKEVHSPLKAKYRRPGIRELKWQHLWHLKRSSTGRALPRRLQSILGGLFYKDALEYVEIFLSCLEECEASVLAGITPLCYYSDAAARSSLEKMHLQDILQRVEMEVQARGEGPDVAVLFCDELASGDEERPLLEHYNQLLSGKDAFVDYEHVNENICFVDSASCPGVQLADFVAGTINGFLRGFDPSERLFVEKVSPFLRRDKKRGLLGYGIYEVPKRPKCRDHLAEKFKKHTFVRALEPEDDDIPF